MKLKVAWFHPHPGYLNNKIFELDQHRDNQNYPWYLLRQYLAEESIDLQTYDVFEQSGQKPDLYIFQNLFGRSITYMLNRKIKRSQCILIAWETKLSHRNLPFKSFMWLFLKSWLNFFPVILTYDRQFIDGLHFRQIIYPQPFFESYLKFWQQKKQHFSTMIVSNKKSRTPGENYSTRRKVIRFFDRHYPAFFDLYGVGWHEPQDRWERIFPNRMFSTSLYRGSVDSKLETTANYKFSFCLENYCYPDYITEKIFDALFVGSVPVYLGAQNITEYVPASCFIDWRHYPSLEHLYQDMVEIAQGERLEELRESGWRFLNSSEFFPFSVENFCQVIYKVIVDLADGNV